MSDSQRHASGDWWLYRRLLSYVVPYSAAFLFSVAGFLVYSLGSVLLADLTQFCWIHWDKAVKLNWAWYQRRRIGFGRREIKLHWNTRGWRYRLLQWSCLWAERWGFSLAIII